MMLVPVSLQLPVEFRLAPAWRIRTGPHAVWAYVHERWNASVAGAEISAKASASTGWLGAGWLGELRWRAGGAGEFGLTAEWSWTRGDRPTERGNEARETGMEGGWGAIGLSWSPPWR